MTLIKYRILRQRLSVMSERLHVYLEGQHKVRVALRQAQYKLKRNRVPELERTIF